MKNDVILYACVLLLGVFIGAVSQVMLKIAANKKHSSKITEYMNPLVIGAYVLFVVTTFMSIFAYRKVPLSMGPVLEATSYLYVTFFGVRIFKEKINSKKIIALVMIVVGICIFAL